MPRRATTRTKALPRQMQKANEDAEESATEDATRSATQDAEPSATQNAEPSATQDAEPATDVQDAGMLYVIFDTTNDIYNG